MASQANNGFSILKWLKEKENQKMNNIMGRVKLYEFKFQCP